jgi:hypothetical protein
MPVGRLNMFAMQKQTHKRSDLTSNSKPSSAGPESEARPTFPREGLAKRGVGHFGVRRLGSRPTSLEGGRAQRRRVVAFRREDRRDDPVRGLSRTAEGAPEKPVVLGIVFGLRMRAKQECGGAGQCGAPGVWRRRERGCRIPRHLVHPGCGFAMISVPEKAHNPAWSLIIYSLAEGQYCTSSEAQMPSAGDFRRAERARSESRPGRAQASEESTKQKVRAK